MNHNFSATEYKNYKKDKNSKIRFKIILFLVMLNKNFFIFKRFTKFKTFSINFYKKKSNHFTLIKAPMAHKKFSKEQFTHQVNSFKIQCISNIYLYEILNTIKVVNLYNFYF